MSNVQTILSPSGVEALATRVIVVPGLGAVAPVGSLTPAQVQELRDDVAAVLNQNLGDLANVSEAGKSTGLVLTVQSDGTWSPQEMTGVIERISQNWAPVTHIDDVRQIIYGPGLSVSMHLGNSDQAFINIVFGSSGSQSVVARADHEHPPTLKGRYQFDKSAAVLGAGTSSLVNQSVTGLVSNVVYDVDITGRMEAVNTNSSGRLYLRTQIGTAAEQSVSRGFSGGVWTETSIDGVRMGVTGATSLQLQFWAEYQSGDPTALYTGELTYTISPRGGTT